MFGAGFDIRAIPEDVLSSLDILNIENPQYTNYLTKDTSADRKYFKSRDYGKAVITDGAYIDVNPAAREKSIAACVEKLVRSSIEYSIDIGSEEIIFLSTFLPMIRLDSYNNSFIEGSMEFWSRMLSDYPGIRISLANLFEDFPDMLLRIARGISNPRFGLTFDAGHALVYSKIKLNEYYSKMAEYCNTVYVHSNDRLSDEHLNPFEGALMRDKGFQAVCDMISDKNIIIKPFCKEFTRRSIHTLKSATGYYERNQCHPSTRSRNSPARI